MDNTSAKQLLDTMISDSYHYARIYLSPTIYHDYELTRINYKDDILAITYTNDVGSITNYGIDYASIKSISVDFENSKITIMKYNGDKLILSTY